MEMWYWYRQIVFGALIILLALLAGCGHGDGATAPSEGQATIGQDGGTLMGPDGIEMDVPADAIGTDITLRIARDSTDAPALTDDATPLTPIYSFTPHGIAFRDTVTARIPFDSLKFARNKQPAFMYTQPGGRWTMIVNDVEEEPDALTVPLMGFSWGYVADLGPAGTSYPMSMSLVSPAPSSLPFASASNTFHQMGLAQTIRIHAELAPYMTADHVAGSCYTTPHLELVRVIGPWPMATPYVAPPMYITAHGAPVVGSGYGSAVDFDVPTDSTHNGTNYFLVRVYCERWRANGSIDISTATNPMQFGFVVLRVNIPVPVTVDAPTITQQPQSLSVNEGAAATFTLAASAPDNLLVHWQRSDDDGATWTTLNTSGAPLTYTLDPVQLADSGARFRASVCNSVGVQVNCITSDVATLTVASATIAPVFTQQPQPITVVAGQTASFSAVVTATPTPTVRWFREVIPGPNIQVGPTCTGAGGQTSCTYTTDPVSITDDGARFFSIATNGTDNTMSTWVTLTVTAAAVAPSITQQPTDQSVTDGGNATFSVVADGTAPLSYQWFLNGNLINGANASHYSISPVSLSDDGAQFSVEVSNGEGTVLSRSATLSVQASTATTIGNWSLQRPLPHANQLEALAVFNGTVFVAGERVTQFSTDQGQTWSPSFNQIGRITDMATPAAGVLLVASPDNGSGAYGVYRSTDNGQTLTQTINDSVLSIAFADSSQGIAINAYSSSYQTTIYHTSDGGQTWTLSQLPVEYLNKVVAVAPDNYVIVGNYGLILRSTDGGQNWIEVNNTGVPSDVISDVAFADASIGVAIIDNGSTLLRTTDGGANWSSVAAPAHAYQVAFADTSHAVIVSQSGQTYYSTDGGQTWVTGDDLNYQGGENIRRVIFADANTGYAVGSRGQVFRTADTGLSWGLVAGGSNLQDNYSIATSSAGLALVGTLNSSLLSTDGGFSWTDAGTNCFNSAFADNNVVVCAAYDNLYRSDDAGNSWSDVFNQPTTVQRHIAFANATTGIAVGGAGEIVRSTDAGSSWSPVASGISTDLWAAGFVSSAAGYVGGPGATSAQVTLLRTSDAGASWTPLSLPVTGAQYGVYAIASPSVGVDLVATAWQIFRSTDGGQNWTLVTDVDADSLCSSGLQALAFTDATHGLAVGGSGCMLRTTDAGISWAVVDLPLTGDYSGVKALDTDTFVVVGAGGLIMRNSQDGAP